MSDIEQARHDAEEAFRRNQQTQMATEQAIRDAATREAYNAKLHHERQRAAEKRKD